LLRDELWLIFLSLIIARHYLSFTTTLSLAESPNSPTPHHLTPRHPHATNQTTTTKIPFLLSPDGPHPADYMAPSAIEVEEINELAHTINDPPVEHNLEEHVAFGGDDQWFYHIPSRRFDLSRGSKRKLIIDADDGIRNHRY
jgi:hypothetical protein